MSIRFCVLGSGSSGNATLLMTPGLHVLIDAGFLPDDLGARLEGTGASWDSLDAIVLTHTHGDHLKKKCLVRAAEHGVQFICHEHHTEQLGGGRYFRKLSSRGLISTYDGSGVFEIAAAGDCVPAGGAEGEAQAGLERARVTHRRRAAPAAAREAMIFHPILVPHDCPPTFGFRIDVQDGERSVPVGYLSDLGECDAHVAAQMNDVALLALEFNHDREMELRSARPQRLIDRVLGREGHLSNDQAAAVLRQVLAASQTPPGIVVQLHLSEECNRPELAFRAAQEAVLLSGRQASVFSSRQDRRGSVHTL